MKQHSARHFFHTRLVALLGLTLLVAACDRDRPLPAPRVNIPYTPEISINEIMVAQIDHAAHFIWEAADPASPATDTDWQEVEHHAIQLLSSRAAMTMGGTGVNDAMWIAQSSWREYVLDMSDAAQLALRSARQQDREGLQEAGDLLIQSCESCHQQFKPDIPTEGYTKTH